MLHHTCILFWDVSSEGDSVGLKQLTSSCNALGRSAEPASPPGAMPQERGFMGNSPSSVRHGPLCCSLFRSLMRFRGHTRCFARCSSHSARRHLAYCRRIGCRFVCGRLTPRRRWTGLRLHRSVLGLLLRLLHLYRELLIWRGLRLPHPRQVLRRWLVPPKLVRQPAVAGRATRRSRQKARRSRRRRLRRSAIEQTRISRLSSARVPERKPEMLVTALCHYISRTQPPALSRDTYRTALKSV